MGEARKVLEKTARVAKRQGWDVRKTGSGHVRFESPDGAVAVTPSTPGKGRSLANTEANLRRAGLGLLPPDADRERRLAEARRARQQLDQERQVIACLEHEVKWATVPHLVQCTEMGESELLAALRRVAAKHPELDVDGDRFAWDPRASDYDTWAVKRQERGLSDLSILTRSEVARLAKTAKVPPGSPELLETVTMDAHSRLLLRDETGKFWLALPVEHQP